MEKALATARFKATGEGTEFTITLEMFESGAFTYGNKHSLVYSTDWPGSTEQLFDARYDKRFNTVESFEKNAEEFVRAQIRPTFEIKRID